jgi:hypothetical protein
MIDKICSPLISVVSSADAKAIAERNNLPSLADLFAPLTGFPLTVRDSQVWITYNMPTGSSHER